MKNIYLLTLALIITTIVVSCTDNNLTYNVTYVPERTTSVTFTETTYVESSCVESTYVVSTTIADELIVYITPTGKKYHYSSSCAGKNAIISTIDEAVELQKEPCKRCVK